MKIVLTTIILFLAITGASTILINELNVEFGQVNYWKTHGVFFLIFISLFPRLTLLLSSVSTGGVIWWLGWLFAPRILVAVLATIGYWQTNPILVIVSWAVALGGESSEKTVVIKRGKPFRTKKTIIIDGHHQKQTSKSAEVIDAEFEVKKSSK